MMFANLEATANAMVLNHLANVAVEIGGVTVPGIFRKPDTVDPLGSGMANTSPTVQVASDAVMQRPKGQQIAVAGVLYVIAEVDHDGTGMATLVVECVA